MLSSRTFSPETESQKLRTKSSRVLVVVAYFHQFDADYSSAHEACTALHAHSLGHHGVGVCQIVTRSAPIALHLSSQFCCFLSSCRRRHSPPLLSLMNNSISSVLCRLQSSYSTRFHIIRRQRAATIR